ncbi:MAG: S-methyl-5-thioribose-1-phosphate isomerase, partial [Ignavibacteriaceae bacterium]|nr:S-methyl-5-thioribose-1-phosphate isomerase [Ignavibacteriaceae bacterium]
LDQTKLPLEEVYLETDDYERIAVAIERLEMRGAPLIGIAAAYALALSLKNVNDEYEKFFNLSYERLAQTRPTAVNLFKSLNDLKEEFEKLSDKKLAYETLLSKAKEIHQKDEEFCLKMGRHGLAIFKQKANVLTHCNTGKLATGGIGTAFGVIKTAFENGLVNHVFADETRPLLQGLRLTAFELEKSGIPFDLQTDSSAAELMKQGKVDIVITGADRIALNGDSANKIGTYNVAILSNYHKIPFYIAAPSTTIDRFIPTGKEIEIEYRNKKELFYIGDTLITPEHYNAFTPAFDVTPAHLISGIITEEGLFTFPYNFIQ